MRPSGVALLFLLALMAGVAGCGGGSAASAARPPLPIHQDLQSLVQATPLIIVGQVGGIQPGRTAGSGEGRLQFNDVRIGVERRLKGEPPPALVVEQVDVAGRILTLEVGPPYKRGERYVLFLQRGEGERFITAIQGRYKLKAGSVDPLVPGPVADNLKGMKEAKFIKEIEAIVHRER
jgi:hypothetical protein